MVYEFGETLKQIEADQINPDRITAGVIPIDRLKALNSACFGFDEASIEACEKPETRFRSVIDTTNEHMFSILSLRDIGNVYGARDRVGVFIKRNLFIIVSVVDQDNSIENAFCEAASRVNPKTTSLERIICFFFERLYYQDNGVLEEYENEIGNMEEQIEKGNTRKQFNAEILVLRRKLLIIRNYYEQLLDLAEVMLENEHDLFRVDKTHHFANMKDRLTRLANNTQLLRDSLVQVREAYQAALDYSENQVMKLFTVITTIFLPLTLLVGWYGMNFRYMPELNWRLGYPAVIAIAVIIAGGCIIYFKKKKLL